MKGSLGTIEIFASHEQKAIEHFARFEAENNVKLEAIGYAFPMNRKCGGEMLPCQGHEGVRCLVHPDGEEVDILGTSHFIAMLEYAVHGKTTKGCFEGYLTPRMKAEVDKRKTDKKQ
jgi:hypothetical protein